MHAHATRAMMQLRAPLRAAAVGGVSAAMMTAMVLEDTLRELSDGRRQAYAQRWAKRMLRLLGVEVALDMAVRERITGAPARLVVANHRSIIDILLMLSLFGGQLLARGDMADWPGVGPMARRAGTLFVDRNSPSSGASAVRRMRDRMRRGITVSVFPEGTTFDGDEVRPFQAGAFVAVTRERGFVLPVGLAYERADAVYGDESITTHIGRLLHAARIRVAVAVGEPIAAGKDAAELAARARTEVQRLVGQARRRVGEHRS
jgi:1-acyl-sn-glycerol-3-phosphate acyltransferase